MPVNANLQRLQAAGVSIWLDTLSRGLPAVKHLYPWA